jgi:hypothetical protein
MIERFRSTYTYQTKKKLHGSIILLQTWCKRHLAALWCNILSQLTLYSYVSLSP